jgi:hypothetical protein
MNLWQAILLLLVAAIAGMMNAIAGGGTILTFPVLLMLGTSPKHANATSTLALFLGTTGGVYGFRKQIGRIKPWLNSFAPVSVMGGLAGSILLTWTREDVFARMVPFLIFFATILFIAQTAFRRFAGMSAEAGENVHPHHHAFWGAVVFQLVVAVYGGYFGAGIGILMLATLGFLGLSNIHEMNALKNILGALINFVASAYFIYAGLIQWPKAAVMTVGAIGGYYGAAHFSQKIPQHVVRRIVMGIGLGISAVLFYKQFR